MADPVYERVLSLDLKHLSPEQDAWLHELKAKAQRIRNAEFMKANGIDSWEEVDAA